MTRIHFCPECDYETPATNARTANMLIERHIAQVHEKGR